MKKYGITKWLIGLFCTAILFSAQSYAITKAQDIKQFTLDNGMKIIVLEDDSIPNANMYLFWKVGSRNEYPGITGLSHFFEHMMFNGSKKYGPKMFDRTMEAAGGSNNAYTTENSTVYSDWFPADALELMFDLEADRIQNLDINADVVENERGVVISERSTGLENSNYRMLSEQVKAAAFRAHPYSWSVIGHESDIANWKLQDLKDFHKTYYAPNNAIVVIVGAIKFEDVKRLAKKYFEPIPAQAAPREVHTVEPKQVGEKRVYVQKKSVTSPNIMFAYHVPETKHEDYYALQVLAGILSDGDTSRLTKELVYEQELAAQVFAFSSESINPNLFYFYAIAAPNVDINLLEKGLITQINEVMKNGVTDQELQKVKNRQLVNFYREMSTINGKANTLGSYEFYFGDYNALFELPNSLDKVSKDDVQRVANLYLRKANRTVGILAAQEDSNENDL
ncbi:M16 family metallopeptidase [Brumicola pallidula]|uniref:Peptidase M16 domain-containing protein n=1 Tax=Brumicola pallidula DSM 14239 = ACAM 615 TaxID=1121922 RepID=K6Y5D1_9ALTE|nr:pitrilysin family protein [Glaciecola pallidula]GAC27994.1 peptidase M16 domain-containing protein [Glaciecola pallidula DSM 14239 = ACAM 615]